MFQRTLRLVEKITPVLKESKFKESGVLTPEEFVLAGDFLVYKCPSWQWASGEPGKIRSYLPTDKQYLVNKNVLCPKRLAEVGYEAQETIVNMAGTNETADEWVATNSHSNEDEADYDVEERSTASSSTAPSIQVTHTYPGNAEDNAIEDDEEFPDADEDINFDEIVFEQPDAATLKESDNNAEGHVHKTRTYDLSITYDRYYQTPRIWLIGYDEKGVLLTEKQIYEDVSKDHVEKTVTFEPHPHLSLHQASIHPCKHANVMKIFIDNYSQSNRELRVEHYLILFLKFIQAIVPTMEYDSTLEI